MAAGTSRRLCRTRPQADAWRTSAGTYGRSPVSRDRPSAPPLRPYAERRTRAGDTGTAVPSADRGRSVPPETRTATRTAGRHSDTSGPVRRAAAPVRIPCRYLIDATGVRPRDAIPDAWRPMPAARSPGLCGPFPAAPRSAPAPFRRPSLSARGRPADAANSPPDLLHQTRRATFR